MKKVLIVCLCLFAFNAQSNEISPIFSNELELMSTIDQVHVVTGQFVKSFTDHVIPAPDPLIIDRHYATRMGSFDGFYYFDHYRGKSTSNEAFFPSPSGSYYSYHFAGNGWFSFTTDKNKRGLNNYHNFPSAKGNAKNLRIEIVELDSFNGIAFDKKQKFAIQHVPDGTKRYFMLIGENGKDHFIDKINDEYTQSQTYLLASERLSSGNWVEYKYDSKLDTYSTSIKFDGTRKSIEFIYELNQVILKNSTCEKTLAHYKINSSSLASNIFKRPIQIKTSDGKSLDFQLKKVGDRGVLSKVLMKGKVDEEYFYDFRDSKQGGYYELTGIKRPDGRNLEIHYYHRGTNEVYDRKVKLDKKTFYESRVKEIKLPLALDGSMVTVRSFFYHFDKEKKVKTEKLSGFTETYDAYGNRKDFFYNQDGLIEKIATYQGNQVYSTQKFFWGPWVSQGQIYTKTIEDQDGKMIQAEHFEYDLHGNVTKHTLFGNLTGELETIEMAADKPVATLSNSYSKEFRYSDDNFNLLLWEKDHTKEVFYQYKMDTNLLIAKITKAEGRICKREFFNYNDCAMLLEKIEDDGSSFSQDDLSAVTVRFKIVFKPKMTMPALGKPEEIIEYYLDSKTHNYILLKKQLLSYDNNHNLTQKKIIDANDQVAYEIFLEYDEFNNLIKETNPLGQVTQFAYDANNNLTKVYLPRKNAYIEMSYDRLNRKIAESTVENNQVKTVQYQYNYNHKVVSEEDANGNKTTILYDHLNRPIEKVLPKIQDATGHVSQPRLKTSYDTLSHVTQEIDARENMTQIICTNRGQKAKVSFSDGSSEKISYYPSGTIRQKHTKTGLVIDYKYDHFDRIIEIKTTDQNTKKTFYETKKYSSYHLLLETDGNGNTTTYDYDGANRLIEKQIKDFRTTYEYDSLGRRHIEKCYLKNALQYAIVKKYDHLDQLIEEIVEDENGNIQTKKEFGYDSLGNQTKITTYGQNGSETQQIDYDLWKRPVKIQDAEGNITTYEYTTCINEIGQKVDQTIETDPSGLMTITTFDAQGRATFIEQKKSSLLSQRKLTYDVSGNLVEQSEKGFSGIFIESTTFDSLDRPIEQVIGKNTPLQKVTKLIYNEQGFLVQKVKPDQTILYFSYDGFGNKLTLSSSDKTVHYRFEYNANSNLLRSYEGSKLLCERKYDTNDLLIEETMQSLTVKKTRDDMGRVTSFTLPDQSYITYQYRGMHLQKMSKASFYSTAFTWENPSYDLTGRLIKKPMLNHSSTIDMYYNKNGLPTRIQAPYYLETVTYNALCNPIEHQIQDATNKTISYFTYDDLKQIQSESGIFQHTYCHDSLYNPITIDEKPCNINSLNQITSIAQDTTLKYDLNGNLIYKKTLGYEIFYYYDALDRLRRIESPSNYILEFQYDHSYRRLEQKLFQYTSANASSQSARLKEHLIFIYDDLHQIGSFENGRIKDLKVSHPASPNLLLAIELDGYGYTPIQDYRHNIVAIVYQGTNYNYQTYHFSVFGEKKCVDYYGKEVDPICPYGFMGKRQIPNTTLLAFGFRDYDTTLHRWITPDPAGCIDGLNLYAFVYNNPLSFTDILGLAGESPSFDFSGFDLSKSSYFKFDPNKMGSFAQNFGQISNTTTPNFNYTVVPNFSPDKQSCVFPIFTGGYYNDFDTQKHYASLLEQSSGLKFGIAPTYNAPITDASFSRSIFLPNTFSLLGAKMGLQTIGSRNIYNACIEAATQAKSLGVKNYTILLTAFSKGAAEACSAIDRLHRSTDSFVKNIPYHIDLITIGGADCIAMDKVKSAIHLIVKGDLVGISSPMFTQALQEGTVRILDPINRGFKQHYFTNPSYQQAVENILKKYNE